jgi:hypothetical protein
MNHLEFYFGDLRPLNSSGIFKKSHFPTAPEGTSLVLEGQAISHRQ